MAAVQVTVFSDVSQRTQQRLHTSPDAIDQDRLLWRLNSPTEKHTARGNDAIIPPQLSDVDDVNGLATIDRPYPSPATSSLLYCNRAAHEWHEGPETLEPNSTLL